MKHITQPSETSCDSENRKNLISDTADRELFFNEDREIDRAEGNFESTDVVPKFSAEVVPLAGWEIDTGCIYT